jgi:uncharacterized membrane protein YedE/YeeE
LELGAFYFFTERYMLSETLLQALFGGALIGLSAALLLLGSGKVAGISGIVFGAFLRPTKDTVWRVSFLLGLLVAPLLLGLVGFVLPDYQRLDLPMAIVAGGLVGAGTRLGNGCTSGHGICGMGRGSKRSVVATMLFMAVAALTVWII